MIKDRVYFCIDMKSFFASVECVERGLDPFNDNLVVCDITRGSGTICLAVSPKMKSLGVKNRCRLFEIPENIEYVTAKPRMKKYIEYAAKIHGIYLDYVDKSDIHVYSIDESFIDVTDYLKLYKLDAKVFAKKLVKDIKDKTGIPATVGIGTNLYLAKIALDITAKKAPDFIGYLDEFEYRKTLWHHRPITDFWQIANGMEKRLEKMGIRDMYDITRHPEKFLYKEFGINAELLIDHAWGKESCTIADIKGYKGKSRSVSTSQILFEDYCFEKARIVLIEMIRDTAYELMSRNVVTNRLNVYIGY
ncbi:MAG: DNA repair protein, partial [Clostridiales bacterium]|nr:DNA repair protein [Clostridiales bacterium]